MAARSATASAMVLLGACALAWLYGVMLELDRESRNDQVWATDPTSQEQFPCPSIHDPPSKYLSVVIPAYNEQGRLPGTIEETLRYLEDRRSSDENFTYEVTIVDDGSRDSTYEVAVKYAKKYGLGVIRQERNRGKGAAIRKGMLCSRGQLLVMADADSQPYVRDMSKLEAKAVDMSKLEAKAANVSGLAIFGSRCKVKRSGLRRIMSQVFHHLVVLVTGTDVLDTQCGLKLFTRPAAARLFTNLRLQRWAFDVEIVYLCQRLGIGIVEVSVNAIDVAGSKIRIFTTVIHMVFEIFLVAGAYCLGVWNIH